MFRYVLSGSMMVLVAISFSQADVSATQTREKQAGITPNARLSVEEETALGNFVLDLLEADEGGNNIHQAIKGKIQRIRNDRAAKPAARTAQAQRQAQKRADRAQRQAQRSSDRAPDRRQQSTGRVQGPGSRGANPAVRAAGGGAQGRGRGRGTGPGNALRHGLQDKDVPGLGRFSNTLLDQGLQGERLTEAIRAEITRRKQQRRAGPR